MSAIGTLGMNAANAAVGGIMGIAFGKQQDQRQIKQQQKLQEMQIKGQQQMVDYNYVKQMQMWKDTNYGAQVNQLKQAGLNPGLLYGMGGGGGTTTGQATGSVEGGKAPSGGGEPIGMGIAMLQAQLMQAQKENIQADTENKKADIPIKQITTTKLSTEIESLAQGIENMKVRALMEESITWLQSMEYNFNQATFEDRANLIAAKLKSAEAAGAIDAATVNNKIDIIQKAAIEAGLKNINIQADTAKKIADIAQGWESLSLQQKQLKLNETSLQGSLENKDQDQIIRVLDNVTGILSRGRIGGRGPQETHEEWFEENSKGEMKQGHRTRKN